MFSTWLTELVRQPLRVRPRSYYTAPSSSPRTRSTEQRTKKFIIAFQDCKSHLLFGLVLFSFGWWIFQHHEEGAVREADEGDPHQHLLEPELLHQRPTQRRPDRKTQAESNIANSVDTAWIKFLSCGLIETTHHRQSCV